MGLITGTTKLLGVIGDPVEHSLSPVMHNAALAQLCAQQSQVALEYVYLPLPVKPAELAIALAGFAAIGIRGFNVTLPHKQAIVPLLNQVSVTAQAVGAVNTVWQTQQGWQGTNTDVQGFLAPLKALNRDWSQSQVVILGCGGAARAVVAGCAELHCPTIQVVARNAQKLQQFVESWQHSSIAIDLQPHLWEALPDLLPQTTLLVNCTPLGMVPQVDQSPLGPQAIAQLPSQAIVYDLIYIPNPTLLLQYAQAAGLRAIDGLEMLIQQGAAALEIWLGQTAPIAAMRQAAREYLGLNR